MRIQNSSLIKAIRSAFGLSISEGFPQTVNNGVQAVCNVNPKDYLEPVIISTSRTTTGASTLFTTSATKDTYINSVSISLTKDATNDAAIGVSAVTATPFGQVSAQNILALSMLTLTAQDKQLSISFVRPIRLARNTAVALNGTTYTVGLMTRTVVVAYTEVEPFEN